MNFLTQKYRISFIDEHWLLHTRVIEFFGDEHAKDFYNSLRKQNPSWMHGKLEKIIEEEKTTIIG